MLFLKAVLCASIVAGYSLIRRDSQVGAADLNYYRKDGLNVSVRIGSDDVSMAADFLSKETWVAEDHSGQKDMEGEFKAGDKTGKKVSNTFGMGDEFKLDDFEMGYLPDEQEGHLGLGYGSTLLEKLKESGKIKKKAFSFYYNIANEFSFFTSNVHSRGQLVLGGTDKAQYHTELQTLPVTNKDTVNEKGYCVDLKDVKVSVINTDYPLYDENQPKTLCFNPMSNATLMPFRGSNADIVNITSSSLFCGGCKHHSLRSGNDGTFKFDFGQSRTLDIRMSQFTIQGNALSVRMSFNMLKESPDDNIYFGADAMKSLYTVFDHEDLSVAWASANYSSSSNIQAF
ncbi:hypothetical protein TRICI_001635 [Trichomonascus ciferrii]|uniref:Peptidase A1 domain-containing protein n=1 Tax=Trichomonascus ciferrii TaxID=44093 RepID=A0A642V7X8_9ASCO|nr:hypothetical protein TRICI_001635 [Trichomonascus ciferrii]